MARTIQVIKDAIRSAKNADPNLNGTNFPMLKFSEEGGSKTSMSNGIGYLVAWAQNLQEQLWDLYKLDIQAIADKAISGNGLWIQNQFLKFQYGDNVILTNFTPGYAVVDVSKNIITACAIVDSGNRVIQAKVAKTLSAGPPVVLGKLSAGELLAAQNYINVIKFAGTQVVVTSNDPDRIQINGTFTIDKSYDQTTVTNAVYTAITNYLQGFSISQFNGILYPSKLEDAIQAVAGVVNVYFSSLKGRTSPVGSAATDFTGSNYTALAGYSIPEDTAGLTLSTTFIAN